MLLIITASNGKNLELAQHLASLAAPMNCAAQVLDLTELDLPLYTPQGHAQGTPQQLKISPPSSGPQTPSSFAPPNTTARSPQP